MGESHSLSLGGFNLHLSLFLNKGNGHKKDPLEGHGRYSGHYRRFQEKHSAGGSGRCGPGSEEGDQGRVARES